MVERDEWEMLLFLNRTQAKIHLHICVIVYIFNSNVILSTFKNEIMANEVDIRYGCVLWGHCDAIVCSKNIFIHLLFYQ